MEKLRRDSLLGRFFATARAKLRETTKRIGVRHVVVRRSVLVIRANAILAPITIARFKGT
jgi:hypothetical protein